MTDQFQTLLNKAKDKGYKPMFDGRAYTESLIFIAELMHLCGWLTAQTNIVPEMIFIEGSECEEQIEMLIEEIDKL